MKHSLPGDIRPIDPTPAAQSGATPAGAIARRKILMILNGKGIGGAELQFLELARDLAQRHDLKLLAVSGGGALDAAPLPDTVTTEIYHYRGPGGALLGLCKVLVRNLFGGPQVIITTSVIGNLTGWLLSGFGRARLVSMQTVARPMRHRALDRRVLRRFDVLIAGTHDIRSYLMAHGQRVERIEVVDNWVDFTTRKPTQTATETRQKLGLKPGTVLVGCIGRLHPQKGQEFLIRAFATVAAQQSNARLVLVGDGPDRAALEAEVERLDLRAAVIFTGAVLGAQYNNLLAAIDIYVQPSRFEGLPRTLLDAMFMARPIIATAVNGHLDALSADTGLLVAPEDPAALAGAILRLVNDRALCDRLGHTAHLAALARYDMTRALARIDALLG